MQPVTLKPFSKDRKTLGFLIAVGVVVLYGILLLFPAQKKLEEMQQELRKVRAMAQEVYSSVPDSRNMAQWLLLMREELDSLRGLLPWDEDVSELARVLSSQAQKKRIKIASMMPQSSILLESCFSVPIEVRLQGRYRDVGELMASLDSFPRLITLQKLSIKRDKNIEPLVAVECEFLTYYLAEKPDHDSKP